MLLVAVVCFIKISWSWSNNPFQPLLALQTANSATPVICSGSTLAQKKETYRMTSTDAVSSFSTRDDTLSEASSALPTVSVRLSDISPHLRRSAFYRSLCAEDESEVISVPAGCCKMDIVVRNADDFAEILQTKVFWGLDSIPGSVLDYCSRNHGWVWSKVTSQLSDYGTTHNLLLNYFKDCRHLSAALESGNEDLIFYWMDTNPPGRTNSYSATRFAADAGNLRVLEELFERGYPWADNTCVAAARRGHFECLQFLLNNGCECDEECCNEAARGGHVDCLQLLHERGCPWDDSYVCYAAALGGHINCLKYAHERGCELNRDCTNTTSIDCLKYILERGIESYGGECYHTVCNVEAPLKRLIVLRDYGATWNDSVPEASLERALEFLMYVMERNCPYKDDIVVRAAALGKLKHLQFLIDTMALSANEAVYSAALMNGHYECVVYLSESGCPCDFELPQRMCLMTRLYCSVYNTQWAMAGSTVLT